MVRIGPLFTSDIGEALYNELVRACPCGKSEYPDFDATIPEEHPECQAVYRVLADAGVRLHRLGTSDKDTRYLIRRWRDYDAAELSAARYLRWCPERWDVPALGYHGDDRILVPLSALRKSRLAVSVDLFKVIVSARFRDLVVGEGIRNCVYRGVTPVRASRSSGVTAYLQWSDDRPPWWLLWSDTVLPPVSPTMSKFDWQGNPVPREWVEKCHAKDDPWFDDVEFHYLRSDLERAGDFDIAMMAEYSILPWMRWRIVSQRFYNFCVKHKIPSDWSPVRIDEG